mmetsp:Transcript_31006/g.46245  ORF Transcript_31006/g.46245 Transcript_31006/m.46245 type:complete len:175 (+) Transcript_31006:1490-2014(+)
MGVTRSSGGLVVVVSSVISTSSILTTCVLLELSLFPSNADILLTTTNQFRIDSRLATTADTMRAQVIVTESNWRGRVTLFVSFQELDLVVIYVDSTLRESKPRQTTNQSTLLREMKSFLHVRDTDDDFRFDEWLIVDTMLSLSLSAKSPLEKGQINGVTRWRDLQLQGVFARFC